MVVFQQPTQSFATLDRAINLADFVTRFDDLVVQPLMISLGMKMFEVCVDSPTQRLLAEKDHSGKAFVFETSEIPFQMGVQIGTLWREA